MVSQSLYARLWKGGIVIRTGFIFLRQSICRVTCLSVW